MKNPIRAWNRARRKSAYFRSTGSFPSTGGLGVSAQTLGGHPSTASPRRPGMSPRRPAGSELPCQFTPVTHRRAIATRPASTGQLPSGPSFIQMGPGILHTPPHRALGSCAPYCLGLVFGLIDVFANEGKHVGGTRHASKSRIENQLGHSCGGLDFRLKDVRLQRVQ